jgi:predicted enzyme related to lactoylglutathione lyase
MRPSLERDCANRERDRQVRDLERAAAFYERELGLERESSAPPGLVVFRTAHLQG